MQTPTLKASVLVLLSSLAVAGCASVPDAIDTQPPSVISVTDVQQNETLHASAQVRWGGTIAGVTNNSDSSDILVVSRPLSRITRPLHSDQSMGRFIARVSGFVEPEVYVVGREITVTGTTVGIEKQLIGATEYPYPVVNVNGMHLWAKRDTTRYPYYPYHQYYPYHPYYPYYHPHGYWLDDPYEPGSSIHGHFIFRQGIQ